MNDLIDLKFDDFFKLNNNSTRGHGFKLTKTVSNNVFCNRLVDCWNGLPADVVSSPNIDIFTNRLEKVDLNLFLKGRALAE